MKLEHLQVYRGYRWHLLPDGRLDCVECEEGYFITGGGVSLEDPSIVASYAHHWRRDGIPEGWRDKFPASFDGIPWEIHEIEDETAHRSALHAYLNAAV